MISSFEHLTEFNDVQRSQFNALRVLLLARTYADLLRQVRSKRSLALAYVGYQPRLLELTEALSDCAGRESTEFFFEGRLDDIYHPSRPLEAMATEKVDMAFIADVDDEQERELT